MYYGSQYSFAKRSANKTFDVYSERRLYWRWSLFAVAFFVLLRVILSGFLDLGNDESYYWTYSQQLQWNYFDHPPLVAIWIRLTTLNLRLEEYIFFIRAGSIAGSAIASLFMFHSVRILGGDKAAFTAVLLYNGSFYAGITAGLLITPDAPLMVFWTAAMYFIVKIFQDDKAWKPRIGFGIVAGLAIMSKPDAVCLWEGMFLFALLKRRAWFASLRVYTAVFLSLVIISPIFFWNLQNDFITFRFHIARVTIDNSGMIHWVGILREIIGELIISNPFIVVAAFVFAFSKSFNSFQKNSITVFRLTGFSLLLIILFIAAFRSALPHWSGPVYICLIPGAAIGLAGMKVNNYRRFCTALLIYCVIFMSAVVLAVNYYPGTFGNKKTGSLGAGDISLDAYGWQKAGKQFVVLYNHIHGGGSSADRPPLVCRSWWGAHEEYFFARPAGIKMIGLGSLTDLHQYAWRNNAALKNLRMDTAYCIQNSHEESDARNDFGAYYVHIDSIAIIPVFRNGRPAYNFTVFQLRGLKKMPLK